MILYRLVSFKSLADIVDEEEDNGIKFKEKAKIQ